MRSVALGLVFAFWPAAAGAQAPLGRIEVSASGTQTEACVDPVRFVAFPIWILVSIDFTDLGRGQENPTNGLLGWEGEVFVPPELSVVSVSVLPPEAIDHDPTDAGFLVDTALVVRSWTAPVGLARLFVGVYTADVFEGQAIHLSDPSGWVEMDGATSHPFAERGALRLGCEAPVESVGWGALKARYSSR